MRKILIFIFLLLAAQCAFVYADDLGDMEDRIQELEDRVEDLDDPSPRVHYHLPYKLRRAPVPAPAPAPPSIRASAPVPATRAIALGTGVLFNASPQVFTNYHVVNGARKIHVKFVNGESIQAKLSYMDEGNDVAMLTLATLPKLPLKRLTLADASKVRIGEKVFTIGYPASHILGREPKYSEGIINALTGAGDTPKMFQISVPIQAGNSGGPLFNEKGAVIGLISSTFVTHEALMLSGTMPQNVNFAVKSSLFADKALAQGKGIATASIVPVPVPFSVSDFVVGIKNNIVLIEAE